MPKGFTEAERDQISAAIIREGRRLFSQFGLKKTSIGDITAAVHISQGAFYLFFSSKEALYFKILEEEDAKIKADLTAQIPGDAESLKAFLKKAFAVTETNPFFRQIASEECMPALIRKLRSEDLQAHFAGDYSALEPLLEAWRRNGIITRAEPEIIASLFRAIFLLSLHKKEIGEALYPRTVDLLIDLVVEGLCK